ncbi:MAG TPA: hypothetical protein DIC35_05415 [Candidatus Moranbacteria bacterium]|nr:hypothetical protein [Candidatus Moranbacteria bacterium]
MRLFEENELNIAALYLIYGQKLSQKHAFWNKLSQEEISHAKNISREKDAFDAIVENKFSRGVVSYIMNFVLEEIRKTKKEKITHKEALHTALRIERSMLEKKCFDMFTPTNQTVKNILLRLNSETEHHVEILLAEMKKNKFTFEDSKK